MIAKNVCITRPSPLNGLYRMLSHPKSERNPFRESLLFSSIKRMHHDGLLNLKSLSTKVVSVIEYSLYTHFLIDVGGRNDNNFTRFGSTISNVKYFRNINLFF